MQTININFYREKNPVVSDAYDRLISKIPLMKKEKGYALFTVTGCEPAVGSTTIAISIAVALAGFGCSALLVDADMRKRAYKKRLSAESVFGLSDVLTGEVAFSDALCETNINQLYYLACGKDSENPVSLLNSERMNELIDRVSDQFEYVIFDSPALNTTIDAAVITAKTSGAILVAGYMQSKKAKIEVAARELEQTGGNLIGIVLNNVAKKDYKRYIENYDYFISAKRK